MTKKTGTILIASSILIGWCLGDGFYGLPVASGTSGFWPGMTVNFAIFLLMIPSALLYTEAILALPDGVNIISLCRQLIGPIIAILIAILFFLLHYNYLYFYFHDILPLISNLLSNFSIPFPYLTSSVILTSLLIAALCLGVRTIGHICTLLITGLFITTIWFCALQSSHISLDNLSRNEWTFLFLALPTYVGAYYYQSIVPSLSTYLNRDKAKICKTIFIASFLIFAFNSLWQLVIIGMVPESDLWRALATFGTSLQGTIFFDSTAFTTYIYHYITFFSITSSMLVNGLILLDVLSDGFYIPLEKRKGMRRFLLSLIVFIPGVLLAPFNWTLLKEEFAGWIVLFFVGPLPIWLTWQVRYTRKLEAPRLLPGGRTSLIILGFISFLLFYVQGTSILWVTEV